MTAIFADMIYIIIVDTSVVINMMRKMYIGVPDPFHSCKLKPGEQHTSVNNGLSNVSLLEGHSSA